MNNLKRYNQNRKRRTKKSYNDTVIDNVKSIIIDSRLGYNIPNEYYTERVGKNK